ncbi:hypothetical protein E4U19_007732 [Claviceps sp. Clav32 group G5]|nr:hypothetical protein E4U19_007732 [Claviceps sp. Clav32 group G5]KAG6040032.1 hypothetical protein E4U39_007348 [Claviceps sp. Clav50 group G5]
MVRAHQSIQCPESKLTHEEIRKKDPDAKFCSRCSEIFATPIPVDDEEPTGSPRTLGGMRPGQSQLIPGSEMRHTSSDSPRGLDKVMFQRRARGAHRETKRAKERDPFDNRMGIPIRAVEVKNSGYIEDGRFVSVEIRKFDQVDLPNISHAKHLSPMTEQEWINTIVQPSMNGFEPGAHYDLGTAWSKLKGFTRLGPWRNERPRTVEDLFHPTSDYDWSIEDGRLMVYRIY